VVHSTTKFISGHGTMIGGALVEAGRFNWANGNFPGLIDPSPGYHDIKFFETFGDFAWLMKARVETLRDFGPSQAPFQSWLLILGLESLPVRMERHTRNGLAVASWLKSHEAVSFVNYPGLSDSPYKKLADKYLPLGAGSIFTFGVKGGREAGRAFIDSVKLCSHLANVGDAKTLVIHPSTTTHQQVSDEDQLRAGLNPDMVRISVGLEDVEDIQWDLDQALSAAQKAVSGKSLRAVGEAGLKDGAKPNGHGAASPSHTPVAARSAKRS
jgi:O-acetylhomoserine (thiol)-lyase